MSFPLASETPPTLSPYQLSFGGYTFGSKTAYRLTKIDGLDLPGVRSGDAGRARADGLFAGLDLLGGREITVQGDISTDGVSLGHALQEARRALKKEKPGNVEKPLYVNYPLVGTLCSMTRVRKRSIPIDFTFVAGGLAQNVTVLFAATDPKFYGATLSSTIVSALPTAGFPTGSGAAGWPLAFTHVEGPITGVYFGGGAYYGSAALTNAGEVEMFPRLLIEGPCVNPAIWNASITGEPRLAFDIEIPTGGTLEVDTDLHTILYYEPGSSVGVPAGGVVQGGSTWWGLPSGANTVNFISGTNEATGQVTVEYAPAYEL